MSGWAKLRPCDRDLSTFVRWANVAEGVFLAVAGSWGIVNFWREVAALRPNAIQFVIFVYIVIFGVLLVLGEVGYPPAIYVYFGVLSTPGGRAWFLFFVATLSLASGLSAPRSAIDHILLAIAGAVGLVLTPLSLCYGGNYSGGGGHHEGGGLRLPNFRGGDNHRTGPSAARAGPDVEI